MDKPKEQKQPLERPDCLRCKHYYVTWDPNFPYGCRSFGFKSYITPCLEVLSSSGQPCLKFEAKNVKTNVKNRP